MSDMDWLPPLYRWLENLPLASVSSLQQGALHVVPCSIKEKRILVSSLPAAIADLLNQEYLNNLGWQGKDDTLLVRAGNGDYFLLVPVVSHPTTSAQLARQVGLDAAHMCKNFKNFKQLVLCGNNENEVLDIFDGLVLGLYNFKFNKKPTTDTEVVTPDKVSLWAEISDNTIADKRRLALAIMLVRILQDAPPNWLNSERLAQIAPPLCKTHGVKCKIYRRAELQELGMGAFLAVASGDTHDPCMLVMEVEGKDPSRRYAYVGKGITFDTGGLSLKPRDLPEMKYDMSGAGAVLGTMLYLAQSQPAVNVIGIVGATENMLSSWAARPSDIVTAMNGKSIEIGNTDAEGRLLLSDLLSYAVKFYQPELLIDIATLTGSVAYSLGAVGAGFFSNNKSAAQRVLQASANTGEPFWQLPMWAETSDEVKGACSDLQNVSEESMSDGIFASCFLQEFIGDTSSWVHLDIAGTSDDCKATGYPTKGGCAYGIRTLVSVAKS